MKKNMLGLAASLALLLGACGNDDDAVTQAANQADDAVEQAEEELGGTSSSEVADELRARGLNTLASAIETVGIENVIQGQTFTLFAPRDDAWLSLSTDDLGNLLGDPARAGELLQTHVVNERLLSGDLADMEEVQSSSGRALSISGEGGDLTIDGAAVSEADIEVGDGVVHIVDSLLAADIIESAQG